MVDFSCNKCNKKFKSQYHLDRHLNRKNPCDKSNTFICDVCKKEFSLKFNYERHLNRKNPCTQNSNEENSPLENQVKLEIEKEITRREMEKIKLKAAMNIELEKEKSKIRIEELREKTKMEELKIILGSNLESTEPKLQYCYVISNDLNIAYNRFKFGRTTCNQKDLIGCYSRGLPNAQVLLYYETDDYIRDENHVLDHFKEHRISHGNGNRKSEWLQIEFERLKDFLDIYFENNVEEIPTE